jgi:deazaflavin-dependent oxidoreductase (nitroreductase family)
MMRETDEEEAQMTDAIIPPKAAAWIKDHAQRYLATDGADGHIITPPGQDRPVPTLLLTTVGRKSGQHLLMPLIYGKNGDDHIIIASRGGAPEHPSWYLNLVDTPEVEVQVLADKFEARARTAHGAERQKLWDMMAEMCPFYRRYQETAGDREIPVIVLERI